MALSCCTCKTCADCCCAEGINKQCSFLGQNLQRTGIWRDGRRGQPVACLPQPLITPASTAFSPSPMSKTATMGSTCCVPLTTSGSEVRMRGRTLCREMRMTAMQDMRPRATAMAHLAARAAGRGCPAPSSFDTLTLAAPAPYTNVRQD